MLKEEGEEFQMLVTHHVRRLDYVPPVNFYLICLTKLTFSMSSVAQYCTEQCFHSIYTVLITILLTLTYD